MTDLSGSLDTGSAIDYSRRDYDGFRDLMLRELARCIPAATWGHPADPMTALVEVLAASADYLSYRLDAVATEAYLPTARLRTSVRRHARLLGYRLHDGCSARTWITLTVAADLVLPPNTLAVTHQPAAAAVLPARFDFAADTLFFETAAPTILRTAWNTLRLLETRPLAAGATSVRISAPANPLPPGGLIAFRGPQGGQVVRLTSVEPQGGGIRLTWCDEDALVATLPLAGLTVTANVALADHGRSYPLEVGADPSAITTPFSDIACAAPVARVTSTSAAAALRPDPRQAAAQVFLFGEQAAGDQWWRALPDLMAAGPLTAGFVADLDGGGGGALRFGDGVLGRLAKGVRFTQGRVRQGGGVRGNLAAGAIAHLVGDLPILEVNQPVAAAGGADPESVEDARRYAPSVFRDTGRIASAQDAASLAATHAMVRRATANLAPNRTFRVCVDPQPPFDADTAIAALGPYLASALVAGSRLQLSGPSPAQIDIGLVVHPTVGADPAVVTRRLMGVFGAGPQVAGDSAFFAAANHPMGTPVYFSDVIQAALAVDGVGWVETTGPQTIFALGAQDGEARGYLSLQPDEVAAPGQITIAAVPAGRAG